MYIGRQILSLKSAIVVSMNKYIKIINNTVAVKQQINLILSSQLAEEQRLHCQLEEKHSSHPQNADISCIRTAIPDIPQEQYKEPWGGGGAATLTKVQVQDQDQDQSRALSISPGEGAGIKAAVTTASSLPPWSRRHEDFCEYCQYYV